MQAKLLRVLETGSFMRVGGEEPLTVDVRIIAASNRNLSEAIEKGRLREDLYYRLKVFHLGLPALRERLDDVPLLAQCFLDEMAEVEGTRKRFSPESMRVLSEYGWPGNVRELRNVVHSAHILAGAVIDVDSLPTEIHRRADVAPRQPDLPGMMTVKIGTPIADVERELIMATLRH
jgi:DNA-binding NtrC family response regulator